MTMEFNPSMIELEKLQQLQAAFGTDPNGQGTYVDEEQFQRVFLSVLEELDIASSEISRLFMKVDAKSKGKISWDEFTSFLFLNESSGTEIEPGIHHPARPARYLRPVVQCVLRCINPFPTYRPPYHPPPPLPPSHGTRKGRSK
jgi:hypothetical protein